jgi:hypothetical protein
MGHAGKDEAAIGGINHFISDQAKEPGECTATLVQFDSMDPHEVVYSMVPLDEAPPRTPENYQPRGSTPLLDAVGMAITHEREKIWGLPSVLQPDLVVVNILTDGEENCSKEWSLERVRKLIGEVQDSDWKVLFTGAGLDAFKDARALGIGAGTVAAVGGHRRGVRAAYTASSNMVSRARNMTSRGDKAGLDNLSYNEDEKDILNSGQ